MKETNIDCMKYRKSTHLAGVDVEMIIAEKGECVLTIKEAYYATGVDVSGNKTDGYFLSFLEDVKPMVVNSGNRKTIANNVRNYKGITPTESRNISNWVGMKIKLTFDPNVKMMGQVVGGIKVIPSTDKEVVVSDVAALGKLNACKSKSELQSTWSNLSKGEQLLPAVIALKDKLKNELA